MTLVIDFRARGTKCYSHCTILLRALENGTNLLTTDTSLDVDIEDTGQKTRRYHEFLAYFPYFEKWKYAYSISMLSLCPPYQFWSAEPIFMKLGMYIMTPGHISTAYFINPSHQSVCLHVYPPIVGRQRLGKNPSIVARQLLERNATAATNTRNNIRIVGRVVFYAVRGVIFPVGE
jgi:hypothetical protein